MCRCHPSSERRLADPYNPEKGVHTCSILRLPGRWPEPLAAAGFLGWARLPGTCPRNG
jgi:hypothetical protein